MSLAPLVVVWGLTRHWMLVLGGIAEAVPLSDALIDVLHQQALVPSECATICLKCGAGLS